MDPWVASVTGDDAANYDAVSLSSFVAVNRGMLVSANAATGEVAWKDKAGESTSLTLGGHALRNIRKSR